MIGEVKHQLTNPLEQYVNTARTLHGSELVDVIKHVLDSPGLYTFTELTELPNVQQLAEIELYAPYWNLLQIFSYGTYKDYIDKQNELPVLLLNQRKKLQHLTIVSLAEKSKCIPYSVLLDEIQISNLRELEDLIIEAVYAEIIQGKLDQRRALLEVDTTIGRDIRKDDISTIVSVLENWSDACETMLSSLQMQVDRANSEKTKRIQRKEALEQEIINLKKSIKLQSQEVDEAYGAESREALGIEKTPKKTPFGKKLGRGLPKASK